MGIIYKVTFKPDPNQIYIGKSVLSLDERRRQHERNPLVWQLSDNSFDKILIRTGIDNWIWEIIEKDLKTNVDLDSAEQKYIQDYLEKGYNLVNIIHNPDHIKNAQTTEQKIKYSKYGAARAWDITNRYAHKARYFSGKIKPVINLTTKKKYNTITELRNKENISTLLTHKLCETGEPNPKNGNQYAFLDPDNNPILHEGHKKSYPILQKIELVKINTGISNRCTLFEASFQIGCLLNELTKMKILKMRGKTNCITCKGFMIFALDDNGERILTKSHSKILDKMKNEKKIVYVWFWDRLKSQWQFDKKIAGYSAVSEYLSNIIGGLPQFHKSKITEILKDGSSRKHIKGYSFTLTSEKPKIKPILKLQPVILLNSGNSPHTVFDNAKFAADELGLNSEYILACCNGKIDSTGGKRFAFADSRNQPIYTNRHNSFLRNAIGSGKSVYWVEGEKTFRSIAACRRHLIYLSKEGDPRVPYVPKAETLAKIASGTKSNEIGTNNYKFKLTLRCIK